MTLDDTRARRRLIVAAAAGLVLRLAFGLLYWVDKPLTHDEREYLALARSVAARPGVRLRRRAREPGTGAAVRPRARLSAVPRGARRRTPVPDATPARVKIAQALVGALTVWLIGLDRAARRRAAGRRVGGRGIAAVYPPLVWMPAYVLSETLYSALALGRGLRARAGGRSRAHGGDARGRRAVRLAVAAGVLAGVAVAHPAGDAVLPAAGRGVARGGDGARRWPSR